MALPWKTHREASTCDTSSSMKSITCKGWYSQYNPGLGWYVFLSIYNSSSEELYRSVHTAKDMHMCVDCARVFWKNIVYLRFASFFVVAISKKNCWINDLDYVKCVEYSHKYTYKEIFQQYSYILNRLSIFCFLFFWHRYLSVERVVRTEVSLCIKLEFIEMPSRIKRLRWQSLWNFNFDAIERRNVVPWWL